MPELTAERPRSCPLNRVPTATRAKCRQNVGADRLAGVRPAIGVPQRDGAGERRIRGRPRTGAAQSDRGDQIRRLSLRQQLERRTQPGSARRDHHVLDRATKAGEVFAVAGVVDRHPPGRVGANLDDLGADAETPGLGVVRVTGEHPGGDHTLDTGQSRPVTPERIWRT